MLGRTCSASLIRMVRPGREASPRRHRSKQPLREAPPPLEGNDLIIAMTGTIAWAVALIVLVVVRGDLPAASRWWIWTCAAGVGFGVFGLIYAPRLKRSRARAAARRAETQEISEVQPNS